MLQVISALAKKSLLRAFRRMLESAAVQDLLDKTLRQPRLGRAHLSSKDLHSSIPPYPVLLRSALSSQTSQRDDVVFITARFRSGSTLLWNLFRHVDGITAYYEPFNERRWFDPPSRGDRIDGTHKHVSDYWREYDGLESLGRYYRPEWISRNLLMDAEVWDPVMKRYIELLIEKVRARPVLQFNRIDFRLPWVRHHFPNATIIHLYRHPREQWCSTLMNLASYTKEASMPQFANCDHFYLRVWGHDLQYHFPFLDESAIPHAYQLFYFVWKLSYLFGVKYSDYSISYESLIDEPYKQLTNLFERLNIVNYNLDSLRSLIVEPSREKWRTYADEDWFKSHEMICDTVMAAYFGRQEMMD
jgi:hypothetical protein